MERRTARCADSRDDRSRPSRSGPRITFVYGSGYPLAYTPVFFWLVLKTGDDGMVLLVPLHLLGMACTFYVLYFVSRTFVMAETGKPASFPDYIGALILFWFFPVGVWFVQPRVNQLYKRAPAASS